MAHDYIAEDQIAAALIEPARVEPWDGGWRARADTSQDDVVLLDRHGRPTGNMPKLQAHQQGRLHLALSVIVRASCGGLLLQRRALGKYHSGGLWTNTCCSHPRPGEASAAAAMRRLSEEMGISVDLAPLFVMRYRASVSRGLVEHELVHVFAGRFDGTPDPDPSEVAEWRWISYEDLRRDVAKQPQAYTVWFRKFLRERGTEIERFLLH